MGQDDRVGIGMVVELTSWRTCVGVVYGRVTVEKKFCRSLIKQLVGNLGDRVG